METPTFTEFNGFHSCRNLDASCLLWTIQVTPLSRPWLMIAAAAGLFNETKSWATTTTRSSFSLMIDYPPNLKVPLKMFKHVGGFPSLIFTVFLHWLHTATVEANCFWAAEGKFVMLLCFAYKLKWNCQFGWLRCKIRSTEFH